MRILIASLLLLATLALAESPFKTFNGSYHISSAPLHDPVNPLPMNTHLYLNIEGDAAKDTYNAMNVKPYENGCGEDHLAKDAGDFTCSFYPKTNKYQCYFSVDVNNGNLGNIGSC